MVAETEIVVAGEIDDSLAIVGADGRLLVVEDAKFEVSSALTEVFELGGEVRELRTRSFITHGLHRKPFASRQ